jgi:hypothetical protein
MEEALARRKRWLQESTLNESVQSSTHKQSVRGGDEDRSGLFEPSSETETSFLPEGHVMDQSLQHLCRSARVFASFTVLVTRRVGPL